MRPLDGITVVALEHAVAGPLCTRQLADLGARVLKIEKPETGDFARYYDSAASGTSSYFAWLNRGKESVELDAGSPEGRVAMGILLDHADVFVQNLAPGAAGRLGLDHATVRQTRPGIVAMDIEGWGALWKERKAYDLLAQAESGLARLNGGNAPLRVGISVADIAAGMYAAQAVLAALVRRGVTGMGAHCTVSLFGALAEWMSQPALVAGGSGQAPAAVGMAHPTIAPYGAFITSDGSELVIAVQNDAEWRALCHQILENEELAEDKRLATISGRVAHRHEVDAHLVAWAKRHSIEKAERLLDSARIAHARVRGVDELLTHPLLADRWVYIRGGDGDVPALLPPIGMDDMDPPMGDVPELGASTVRILGELGVSLSLEGLNGVGGTAVDPAVGR